MSETTEYAESLKVLAHHVLDTVIAVFEQYGVDLPERRYVTLGNVAHDCEQVTVSLQQVYLGPPGDQAASPMHCNAPRTAFFFVEVVRKQPIQTRQGAPTPEAIEQAADQQLIDAYLLLEAGANAVDEYGLGVLADVAPGDQAGDMRGVSLNLTIGVP